MPKPLVSVIMPTYNYGQFIGEAVKSVLSQSYEDIELIVVDNYSTDNTKGIVKSFDDPRIRYFKFSNKGIIAKSRNFAIKKSLGEYIAFIDSDDVWFSEKLSIQMDYLRDNPEIALITSSLKLKGPDKRYNNRTTFSNSNVRVGYLHRQLLDFNFISFSAVVLKRLLFDEIGYFDDSKGIAPGRIGTYGCRLPEDTR